MVGMSPPKGKSDRASCQQVVRGYFSLRDHEELVHVTSDEDFLVYIWARNVETFPGGIQVMTPPSQFRGAGSTGPQDVLGLDVPAQTGMDLGCIGAKAGEGIELTSGERVTIFVTVVTAPLAAVSITTTPAS